MNQLTKRLVCLILAIAVAMSLAVPVGAEELTADTNAVVSEPVATENIEKETSAGEEETPAEESDTEDQAQENKDQADGGEKKEQQSDEGKQDAEAAVSGDNASQQTEDPADKEKKESEEEEQPIITLNLTELELTTGKSAKLKLNGGEIASLACSDGKVASVSKDGTVAAKHVGKAVVTVTDAQGNGYTCDVTVRSTTTKTTARLSVGKSVQLKLKNTKIASAKSSKKSVAKVSKSGKVEALRAGTADITLTDTEGNLHVCTFTVKGQISQSSLTLSEKKTAQLEIRGAAIKKVMSSNTAVAKVAKDGTVTAKKTGTATITLTDNTGTKFTSKVTVKANYLARTAAAAKKVYGKIVSLHCRHKGGMRSYSQLLKKRVVTCGTGVSVALQEAGLLKKNDVITHTNEVGKKAVKKKNKVSKALKNKGKLKSGTYTIYKAGKKYSKLPAKYKAAGMIYVQDSNICISAGGGYIYSTNESSSQYKHGHYYKTKVKSGYPFTHEILYVIVPNS